MAKKRRTKKSRREAALKGWETRRRKARAAKRLARKAVSVMPKSKTPKRKAPPTPPKRTRKAPTPPKKPEPEPEPEQYDEPLDDFAGEWEIGFEYRGGDKGSAVDVNIRIAREDGEAFGPREANRVLEEFKETLLWTGNPTIPAGYMMAFIDWHRPRWGTVWQQGDDVDLDAFANVMREKADDATAWTIDQSTDTRLGSVRK